MMEKDEKINRTSITLNVDFDCSRDAEYVKQILEVDKEPKRSTREFSVDGKTLTINVNCPDVRELRLTTNALLDNLHLITQTINRFGPSQPPPKRICNKP